MEKVKKLILAAMALVVMFALTACMEANEVIKINSDGSATMVSEISIDKEKFMDYMDQYMKEQTGSSMTSAQKAEMEQSMLSDGTYKLEKKNGKEYYVAKNTQKISNKALNKAMNEDGSVGYIKSNVFYLKAKYDTDDEMEEMLSDPSISQKELEEVIKCTYSVQFPKEIKCVYGGKISKTNKKVAVFDIKYGKTVTMFASTSKSITLKSTKNKIKTLNAVSKTKITRKSSKKNSVDVRFSKVKGATKYEVMYSTSKNFKNNSKKTVTSTKATIKGLKSGTRYYVRVRAAKKNYADKYVYSAWSTTSIKTAK